jgi:hypothetical protein
VSGKHTLRVKSHSACGNCTLRVEINLEPVEITLVRVGVTFVPVEIPLREIQKIAQKHILSKSSFEGSKVICLVH